MATVNLCANWAICVFAPPARADVREMLFEIYALSLNVFMSIDNPWILGKVFIFRGHGEHVALFRDSCESSAILDGPAREKPPRGP